MRKLFSSLVLILLLIVSSIGLVAAQPETDNISPETVITEKNIEDVLNYFGIDLNNLVKMDKTVDYEVTVKDLENAIETFNQSPSTLTSIMTDDNSTDKGIESEDILPMSWEEGTKTIVRDVDIGSYVMRYTVSGGYYIEYAPVYFRTWTSAGSARVDVQSSSLGHEQKVERIRTLTNRIFNQGTENAYLRLDYDYDVGHYLLVEGLGIKIGEQRIEGFMNFNTTWI